MISPVDRLFPEDHERIDPLAGLPDFTDGQATRYFFGLSESSRTLVQQFAINRINPLGTGDYVIRLVEGYDVQDPNRSFPSVMRSVIAEVDRTRQLLQVFDRAKDFFPAVKSFSVPLVGHGGHAEAFTTQDGWTGLTGSEGVYSYSWQQRKARDTIYPVLAEAETFLRDPNVENRFFDQAEIQQRHRKDLAARQGVFD